MRLSASVAGVRADVVCVAVAVLAGVSLAAGSAAAQGVAKPERPQVAVVRLTFTGGVAEAARELFAQRLVEGLAVAEFQVTSGAPVAERLRTAGVDATSATSCADEACYRRAGAGARRRVPGDGRRR